MKAKPDNTGTRAEALSEFFARIIIVGFCGTFCFIVSAETLRAIENDNFSWNDAGLPLGAVVLGVVSLQSLLRLWGMSCQFARHVLAEHAALYESKPEVLESVFSRLPSKIGWLPVLLMSCLPIGVIFTIFDMAEMRGETTTNTLLVCLAATVSMLTIPWAAVQWNCGHRIRSMIVGTGGVFVFLFWAAVATSIALDQLNFSGASPGELAMASAAVFFGGVTLAGLVTVVRIRYVFIREAVVTGHAGQNEESLATSATSSSEQATQNAS